MSDNYVLITGCTSGIGRALTFKFAENGYNLVLVSRNYNKLISLQNQLDKNYNIKSYVIEQDLSMPNSALSVYQQTKNMNICVDILCNNAGMGLYGSFDEYDVTRYNEMIQLNISSLMELTYYFVKDMKINNKGKILNIGSTGSFVSGPYMAVYYATKAFVLSFSEAVAMELSQTNINVTCICPGTTKTEFFDKATNCNINLIKDIKTMSSEEVAEFAYHKLMKNKIVAIPGFKNKIAIFSNRLISRKLSRKIVYNIQYKRGKGKIK